MPADDAQMDTEIDGLAILTDEERRKLLIPAPDDEQVVELLNLHFADSSAKIIKHLDSYDDRNYHVEIDGEERLFKIHNGVESEDFIRVYREAGEDFYKAGSMGSVIHLQNTMLELCAEYKVPSSVPIKPKAALHSPYGSPVMLARLPCLDGSTQLLAVRLLSWIKGRPMSSIKTYSMEVLAEAGRFLGTLDKTLDNLSAGSLTGAMYKIAGSSAALLGRGSFNFGSHASRRFSLFSTSLTDFKTEDLFAPEMPPPARTEPVLQRVEAGLGMPPPPEKRETTVLDSSILDAARRYHQWDGKNTADLRKFTGCIQNDRRRGLIESILDAFEKQIKEPGVDRLFRTGVNHGDFNDANILLDNEFRVVGVIDFGDSTESWRVLDASVAMAYAMLSTYGKANRSLSAAAAFLRGYHAMYPLSDVERKHLPLLMACRLACSVTLGAFSLQQNPGNTYLLLHAEPAWRALELLWPSDPDDRAAMTHACHKLFDQACLYSNPREKVVTCYDLQCPDPTVADLLVSVRVTSFERSSTAPAPAPTKDSTEEPPTKKQKVSSNGLPVITFVTGNAKKLEEVERILKPDQNDRAPDKLLQYKLTNEKVDLPELQGEPIAIAREKCLAAAEKVGGPVITEDTSLCFNALNGLPGPYIKWFLDSCGHDGLNKMLGSFEDKTAYAQTVVAFCAGPGNEPIIFDGRTSGKIVPARGKLDFGWDPIFEPNEGDGKTYAEMSKEEKDSISHRSRAFAQLRDYMNKFRADVLSSLS